MAALDTTEVKEGVDQETVDAVRSLSGKYKYGWETEIEMDYAPKGLTEDIVRLISEKNDEPEWMLPISSNIWPTTFDITIWLDQLWIGMTMGSLLSSA